MRGALLTALAFAALQPSGGGAQQPAGPQWELRAEAFHSGAVLGGVGAVVPVGTYVRAGGVIAGGAHLRAPREPVVRGDALLRFHLDPLRQSRKALYGAAGVSLLLDQDGEWRPYLLARLGVEGPARGRWVSAAEMGLGGGAHVAVVLRRARPRGR